MTKEFLRIQRVHGWSEEKDGIAGYGFSKDCGWLPKEDFEKTFRPTGNHSIVYSPLTFSEALEAMKMGKKVRRLIWKIQYGLREYVYLEKNKLYGDHKDCGTRAQQTLTTDDILAEDWIIL